MNLPTSMTAPASAFEDSDVKAHDALGAHGRDELGFSDTTPAPWRWSDARPPRVGAHHSVLRFTVWRRRDAVITTSADRPSAQLAGESVRAP
jgi:hypothetical protein